MAMVSQQFAFQRLEVYQVAKAVAQMTIENRRHWSALPGELAERLARAVNGLLAEIASGAAMTDAAEQRRHFQVARSRANEAMSCIELARMYGVVPTELRHAIAQQLARVDGMLNGMIRRRSTQ